MGRVLRIGCMAGSQVLAEADSNSDVAARKLPEISRALRS